MSQFLDLPTPLSAATITLGQLIGDPLSADSVFLKPSQNISTTQTKYDEAKEGAKVQEKIVKPLDVFNSLRQDNATRSFLRKLAYQNKPVYFVTGIQTLKTSATKPTAVVTNPAAPQYRLPVRRVDSASNIDMSSTSTNQGQTSSGSVIAVELREVKCRIGAPSEPHRIGDLSYDWSYHTLDDEDMQLAVGLGEVVKAEDFTSLTGVEKEESREAKREWRRQAQTEVEGLGGF